MTAARMGFGGFEEEGEGQRGAGFTGEGEFCLQDWALPSRQFLLGAAGATLSWDFPWKLKKITASLLPKGCSSLVRNSKSPGIF